MSHSLVLGALLLSLVSSEASQQTVLGEKLDVIVESSNPSKGIPTKSFCSRALQRKDPNAVVMDGGNPVPLTEFCKAHAPYATHNGSSIGNSYIKYEEGKEKNKWIKPTDFCNHETALNCSQPIRIKYDGIIANCKQPTKTLGEYCKGYGKDLGCTQTQ